MISSLDMQNNILKILIDVLDFQAFFLLVNYYYYKNTKSNGIKEIITCIIYTSISIFAPGDIEYPLQIIVEFLYLLIVYKKSIKQCIIPTILFQAFNWGFLYIVSGIIVLSRILIFGVDSIDLSTILVYNEVIMCSLIAYTIISFFILYKSNKKCFKETNFSLAYLFVSILGIAVLIHLNRKMASYTELFSTLVLIYTIVVILEIVNVHLFSKMIASINNQIIQQVEIEKYQLESDYTKQIDDSLRQVSKLRHDFKNQLIVLQSYAEQNRTDELIQYIQNMQDMITTTKIFNTPNPLISSLLNSKNMLCEKNNIIFNVNCLFESIHVGDFEIMTILGNLLDNAITAASPLPNGYINLSIVQLDSYIEITCENNHNEQINESNGLFKTTKKDTASLHGLGISNIKDVVKTLNGTSEFQYDQSKFSVRILLPNY